MSFHEPQAAEYLRPPEDGLWTWAENGNVLVWRDGRTVGFREEFVQLTACFAPQPLPPFGCLVLLAAACRGIFPNAGDFQSPTPRPAGGTEPSRTLILASLRGQLRVQVEQDLRTLQRVSELPGELISQARGKRCLALAVFESAKAERHTRADVIQRHLQDSNFIASLQPQPVEPTAQSRIRHLHLISEGLAQHSSESLGRRLQTGLDELPEAADLVRPPMELARALLEELSRKKTHEPLVRATRDLLAAIRLPRSLGRREEMALGGTADITNRGPLDRLLLSELAHDDLTLSMRLAMNEALFLRREPPSSDPPTALAILLDSGIRLWGQPRVLATATALALLALDRPCSRASCWRAQGARIVPVDLLTKEGLQEHLIALETASHPGESLEAFGNSLPTDIDCQSVLITHRDAFRDPAFRRALIQAKVPPTFIATIDRVGTFELHAFPYTQSTPVSSARLDVSRIFEPRRPEEPSQSKSSPPPPANTPDQPALLRVRPFPFLIPVCNPTVFAMRETEGPFYRSPKAWLAITTTRHVVRYSAGAHGAEILGNDRPPGPILWMGSSTVGVHLLLEATTHLPPRWVTYPLDGDAPRVIALPKGSPIKVAFRSLDDLILIRSNSALGYCLTTGKGLAGIDSLPATIHGRYSRSGSAFLFLRSRSGALGLDPVILPEGTKVEDVLCLFDREGHAGPWMLKRDGSIQPISNEESPVQGLKGLGRTDVVNFRISRDGHRVKLLVPGETEYMLVDLEAPNEQPRHVPVPWFRDAPLNTMGSPLLRNIMGIVPLPTGLGLLSGRKKWWKIQLGHADQLRLEPLSESIPHNPALFEAKPGFVGTQCSLRLAQLPNGSRAWLDNRGLLHLKSHDPEVPEISMLLSLFQIAAWSSDGKTSGPKGFFVDPQPSEGAAIFGHLMQFRARL